MLIACDLFFSFVRSLFRWFLRLVVLCLSGCSTPGHANPAIGSGAKLMVITLWPLVVQLYLSQGPSMARSAGHGPKPQAMARAAHPWLQAYGH